MIILPNSSDQQENAASQETEIHEAQPAGLVPNNPLPGKFGIIAFVGLCISEVVIGLVVSTNWPHLSYDLKIIILQSYMTILGLGWFVFAICTSLEQLGQLAVVVPIIASSYLVTVFTNSVILFWVSLGISVIWTLYRDRSKANQKVDLGGVLLSLYSVWAVVCFLITVGRIFKLPFVLVALETSKIEKVIDIRYVLSAIFVVALTSEALLRAFKEAPPKIPSLPRLRIDLAALEGTAMNIKFKRMIFESINLLLDVIQWVTEILWRLIALLAAYLYRTGTNLERRAIDLVRNLDAWRYIVRTVGSIIALVLFSYIIIYASPSVHAYLRTNSGLGADSLSQLSLLGSISSAFGLVLLIVVAISFLWSRSQEPLLRATFAGVAVLVAAWLSGHAIFLLSFLHVLPIQGFGTYGWFSILVSGTIGLVFVYQLQGSLRPMLSKVFRRT